MDMPLILYDVEKRAPAMTPGGPAHHRGDGRGRSATRAPHTSWVRVEKRELAPLLYNVEGEVIRSLRRTIRKKKHMNPRQITPASTAVPISPTKDTDMTSTAPALTSAQLRAARGVSWDAPISAYLDEVWVDPWAMAAADDVVTQHDEGLSDAEFDDQLSAIIATERQAETQARQVIEPVEELVLTDELLDLAVEVETAALRAESTQPTSGLMAEIESADFSEAPWSRSMGYSAEKVDRLAVESAHRQAEREEMAALWREQERMDELDALMELDFTGVEIEPLVDLSDLDDLLVSA